MSSVILSCTYPTSASAASRVAATVTRGASATPSRPPDRWIVDIAASATPGRTSNRRTKCPDAAKRRAQLTPIVPQPITAVIVTPNAHPSHNHDHFADSFYKLDLKHCTLKLILSRT
jgi:hypothetical protein